MQFSNPLYRAKATAATIDSREQYPIDKFGQEVFRDMTAFSFFEDGAKRNSVVSALISLRADAVARFPLVLYDEANPEIPIPYSDSIPLYKLLKNPNPYHDFGRVIS